MVVHYATPQWTFIQHNGTVKKVKKKTKMKEEEKSWIYSLPFTGSLRRAYSPLPFLHNRHPVR